MPEDKAQAQHPQQNTSRPKGDGAPRLTGLKKRQQIELAGRNMFIWVAIAAVAVSFCLATGQYLFSQWLHNNRVIGAKYQASTTLSNNISAAEELKTNVDALVANTALASVKTNQDDSPTKSVLDALPTANDPAALGTSLQKAILGRSGVSIDSITLPSETQEAEDGIALKPTPQEIPFSFTVTGTYGQIRRMVDDLERTIRPIRVVSMTLNGTDASLRATVDAVTYYQPAKTVGATEEVIR